MEKIYDPGTIFLQRPVEHGRRQFCTYNRINATSLVVSEETKNEYLQGL